MADQGMSTANMCEVDENVAAALNKLKFAKTRDPIGRAIIMKIKLDCEEQGTIVIDDELEDITTEELKDELPEQQPRYIVYSFKWVTERDDRITNPHCFIYYKPHGCKTALLMRYAGSKGMVEQLSGATKSQTLENSEEFDDQWLKKHFDLK